MTDAAQAIGLTVKAGMLPMTILELRSRDLSALRDALAEKVRQSPEFFHRAPVVLAVEKLADPAGLLQDVRALCVELELLPVAVRGGNERIRDLAWDAGLAWYPPQQDPRAARDRAARQPQAAAAAAAPVHKARVHRGTVRGGQQVSAPEGDLVVIGAVNAGAEVLAAGSVHVYGPLRGRALAGIHGEQAAGIFCQELHAELVAIAGSYKRLEDIDPGMLGAAVQVRLQDEQIELLRLDRV